MAAQKGHTKAGGRKKGTPNQVTTEIRAAFQKHGEELVRALLALCKSDDERVRLGAITAALDRGWGKPAQALQITGDPDSPVVFNLRLGDGMVDGGAVEVLPVPGTGLDGCSVSGREGTGRR